MSFTKTTTLIIIAIMILGLALQWQKHREYKKYVKNKCTCEPDETSTESERRMYSRMF